MTRQVTTISNTRQHVKVIVVFAAVFFASSPLAMAQGAKVVITGGIDDQAGHFYKWTVKNRHTSPIVYLEFPQYGADLFDTPKNWTQKTENLVNVGWNKDETGLCVAQVENPDNGIKQNRTDQFGMRIARGGADRGVGPVKVKFADGTEFVVKGVKLPTMSEPGSPYLALIGAAVFFAAWVVYREVRQRRRDSDKVNPAS